MTLKNIVIIGASAAGVNAAKEIRTLNDEVNIVLLTDESHRPYYRPYLTEYIADSSIQEKSNFYLLTDKWIEENDIVLKLNENATAIDALKGIVKTDKGNEYPYDKLIISCGSSPFVPIKKALEKKNVFSVRTFDDARHVHEYSKSVKKAVVIGGGLLGIEAAYSFIKRGIDVTIVELSERLLPNQLDDDGSAFYERLIANDKLDLQLGESVASITGEDVAEKVVLSSGKEIDADIIVFSIGVRSNVKLAQDCGLDINRAIVVNDKMEASIDNIYACGDVAEHNGKTVALWMNAVRQGKVAGANSVGQCVDIGEEIYPAVLSAFDTRLYSVGNVCGKTIDKEIIEEQVVDADKGIYQKMFFKDDIIIGAILIGDISKSQKIIKGIKNKSHYEELAN